MPGTDHTQHLIYDFRVGIRIDLHLNFRIIQIKTVVDLQNIERKFAYIGLAVIIRAAQIKRLSPIVADGGKLQQKIRKKALDLIAHKRAAFDIALPKRI